MLDNMAGNRSEMSAISLYTYNQLITDEHNEIAELFHKISIVEMRHLYIFGTLAKQLGADPPDYGHRIITEQYIGHPDLISIPKYFLNS